MSAKPSRVGLATKFQKTKRSSNWFLMPTEVCEIKEMECRSVLKKIDDVIIVTCCLFSTAVCVWFSFSVMTQLIDIASTMP